MKSSTDVFKLTWKLLLLLVHTVATGTRAESVSDLQREEEEDKNQSFLIDNLPVILTIGGLFVFVVTVSFLVTCRRETQPRSVDRKAVVTMMPGLRGSELSKEGRKNRLIKVMKV